MTLNDDDSKRLIADLLQTNEWSEEEIEDLWNDRERLEEVVKSINEALVRAHDKVTPKIEEFQKRMKKVEEAYLRGLEKLGESYGEDLPVMLVGYLFKRCADEKEKIEEEMREWYERLDKED